MVTREQINSVQVRADDVKKAFENIFPLMEETINAVPQKELSEEEEAEFLDNESLSWIFEYLETDPDGYVANVVASLLDGLIPGNEDALCDGINTIFLAGLILGIKMGQEIEN